MEMHINNSGWIGYKQKRILKMFSLLVLLFASTSSAVEPQEKMAQLWAGNGFSGPLGDGASVSGTTTTDGPNDAVFNPIRGDLYFSETDGCRIRSVRYFSGTVSTLIGDVNAATCMDQDHDDPLFSRVKTPIGIRLVKSILY